MFKKRKIAHSAINEDVERVIQKDTPFAISESFRMLYTNVIYLPIASKCKRIVVTSPVSGEGKTYISVNLSRTLANNSDKKVILIDMDMRVPRIKKLLQAKTLETKNFSGLSEYLAGIDNVPNILKTDIENFHVLFSGKENTNPIGLINSPKMEVLLSELSESYDYVIIDTPPVNIVSDALLMLNKVDGYILSSRANYSNVNALNSAIESIRNVGGEVFGVVLTDANVKNYTKSKYRYKYSRGDYN